MESKAHPLWIVRDARNLAVGLEETGDLVGADAVASVSDTCRQEDAARVVEQGDDDSSLVCELDRVGQQVYQDLAVPSSVGEEFGYGT